MLSDFTGADKVYIACGYTDLRRGIDGLAGIVQQQFHLDPFTNTLFLFCGRRRDRIKALYWEGNGFVLLYKRLENGVFQWSRSEAEACELTPQQYRWLMEGLQIHGGITDRPAQSIPLGNRAEHRIIYRKPMFSIFHAAGCCLPKATLLVRKRLYVYRQS